MILFSNSNFITHVAGTALRLFYFINCIVFGILRYEIGEGVSSSQNGASKVDAFCSKSFRASFTDDDGTL